VLRPTVRAEPTNPPADSESNKIAKPPVATVSNRITKATDPEPLKMRDMIYHTWGTGWAALGLLETLPAASVAQR